MATAAIPPHIERAAIEAEIARRSNLSFTYYTKPDYEINWHHKVVGEALDRVLAGKCRRLMIFEPPQNGKALALETPIPTPEGWRCLGDLKVGNLVFDHLGQPTSVVAVSPVWKERQSYRVTADTKEEIIADSEHDWFVIADRSKRRDFIGKLNTSELAVICQSNWKRQPAVFHHTGLILPYIPLPIDPYVLGQWLGNGSSYYAAIHTGGPIGKPDQDFEWVRARVAAHYPTSTYSEPHVFGVPGLNDALRSLSLLKNKHIPSVYLRSSNEQRLALLQGLIDSDGSVSPKGCIEFCSINKLLAEQTRELVISLGVKSSWIEDRATINGQDCGPRYRVIFFMDRAASLPRKAMNCRNQIRPDHYLTVERTDPVDTVCIEVDSPQHLFLAGQAMIPTCNSEQVSRRFPAFAFGRNPNLRIIACSYNDSLAQDMSRDIQKIMLSREYRTLFPNVRLAEGKDPEKRTQGQFDVVGGSGYYIAVGIMGSMTGKTSDIGIVDDPVKNRAEAESEVYRERVWEQYKSAFATRQFGDKGSIIVCLTRWHQDDLAGRLIRLSEEDSNAEKWEVLNFPAIRE